MTTNRSARTRAAQAVGFATTALAGALSMMITAPQATADSSYQPALDQLLDAMQQAVAYDSALPFATPDSDAMLLTGLQNTNYELLSAGLSRVTELFDGVFFQSPEVVAGDAADSRQYFQFFTPDIYYHATAGLAPGATYELTGTVGNGTEALAIATEAITGSTAESESSLELDHGLVVNPDGTFTVDIGPTDPSGAVNFINDTDATTNGDASLLIRDVLGDWAQGPGSISIHCVSDCPAFFSIPSTGIFPSADASDTVTATSTTQITSVDSLLTTLFTAFGNIVGPFNQENMGLAEVAGIELPTNTMSNLAPETSVFATGLPSAEVSGGNFDLDPGEALIVKVPDVTSAYSGIELMNVFGAALPYTLAQTTLNNTTAFQDPDGYTYYVVSATNPGVANWLDSNGVTSGEIFARFENLPDGTDPTGLPVTTEVVPVADVANYLPADTPTVSPAEYAADMSERVLSYDYALDVSRENAQPDWVIQELILHGLQGVMGTDNFDAVFGSDPETPLGLRFTPALAPDWATVDHDIVTNPVGSLEAIFNNLPLAFSDISLPTELALGDTVLSLLLPQQLGSLLDDSVFDPNTGIIAGLLNARDDLATAVLTANDDFPSQLGSLATAEWENMPELVQATGTTLLADLSALLNPADFVAG
ncbi:MAG TPA: hypothetical protein VKI00_04090 [Mycobacterium sp.]|uniref:hypothetical protein n=1 Tax=Mycobacterium sp. TaxID=1785 RepID=UPI002C0D1F15|nr:hypothetical protein [Mycobacterium sp.]HME74845.1 hypothetical protein [Mycobacterium sp.]